jgi:hypothetical protein
MNRVPSPVALALAIFCIISSAALADIPVVTSPTSAAGTVGSPFRYLIYAQNTATSYGATPLPAGLSLDPVNGIISGTPVRAGTNTLTISASNASGTGTATLTLAVNASGSTVVQTYPGPGVNTYLSSHYTVTVYNGTVWLPSYTYAYSRKSVSSWNSGASPSVNFTTFGTTGPVVVEIAKTTGTITSMTIEPASKNISYAMLDGQALVTMNQNDKLWITVNGDGANPLFIFADAPKPAVPTGATYFGPGVTDIAPATGNHYQAKNNEVIYLDGGAWVLGNISVMGTSNVQIIGPGVLSGELWTSETVNPLPFNEFITYCMVYGDGPGNSCSVQGITMVASPAYNIHYVYCATGVKVLSPWYYGTDGFYALHTDQCFAFNGDNTFFPLWYYAGSENVTIVNSFGGNTNNAVIGAGYWGFEFLTYATLMDNIDIKTFGGGGSSVVTPAVFQQWVDNSSSSYGFQNKTFQNIRIDGNVTGPLLQLENRVYPWNSTSANPPLGNSSNFVFKNISLSGTQSSLSAIAGYDSADGWQNVSFQDFTIGGTLLTASNVGSYISVNSYVSNLTFSTAGNETVTASAGVGGIISPAGATAVSPGASQTFLITPAAGVALASVSVDNVPQGAIPSYTFTNVTSGHTITASFVQPLTFSKWEALYPSLTDLSATDTPQNDGVPTMLKYLYNINPTHPMTAADRAALPAVGSITKGGSAFILTYRRYALATGIVAAVQTSPDLITWTTLTNPCVVQTGADPNTGDPMMRVTIPVTGSQEFVRLSVTLN